MLCSAEFTASATAHTVEEPTGTRQIAQLHLWVETQLLENYRNCLWGPKFQEAASHDFEQLHVCISFFFGRFWNVLDIMLKCFRRNLAMWLNISAVEMCWAGTSTTILIKFEEKARESCENRGTSGIVTHFMRDPEKEKIHHLNLGRLSSRNALT